VTKSQRELVAEQYKDASNLNARIALHQRFSTNHYGWWPWVFDQFDLPPEGEILVLGCGPADLWKESLSRLPNGWRITLSDASPGMIETAQANLAQAARPFRFQVIDAQSIPFEDQRFDAVTANHMLYHVPDKDAAFAEIHRVLKPGGHLYATTVGQCHMRELDELVVRFLHYPPPLRDGTAANSFLLENGGPQLEAWFSQVGIRRYKDNLVVTDAQPLIAYALSLDLQELTGERQAEFARFVEDEIARTGSVHITKDSGMFVAIRPQQDKQTGDR
jgi:ubiquinone/menaquinone biosynthesis C-methylase UbiE